MGGFVTPRDVLSMHHNPSFLTVSSIARQFGVDWRTAKEAKRLAMLLVPPVHAAGPKTNKRGRHR